MDRKFQVFVSSTFADLEEERSKVIQTLMKMGCIPSSMELFPAADEEQLEFIKRILDDCDYYLLLIGGKYGSLAANGLSYTELEYEYAIEIGMNVIALLHKYPESIPAEKTETDIAMRQKLMEFRKRVSENRLVDYWEKIEELPGVVALSVTNAINLSPTVGWVRGDRVISEETQLRLLKLEEENARLKEQFKSSSVSEEINKDELARGDEKFNVDYSYELTFSNDSTKTTISNSIPLSWDEIFSVIGVSLLDSQPGGMQASLSKYIFEKVQNDILKEHGDEVTTKAVGIDASSISIIAIQFRALGLITHDGKEWKLTPLGDRRVLELNAIKSNSTISTPVDSSSAS